MNFYELKPLTIIEFQLEALNRFAIFKQQQREIFDPIDATTIVDSTLRRQVDSLKQIGVSALEASKLEDVYSINISISIIVLILNTVLSVHAVVEHQKSHDRTVQQYRCLSIRNWASM